MICVWINNGNQKSELGATVSSATVVTNNTELNSTDKRIVWTWIGWGVISGHSADCKQSDYETGNWFISSEIASLVPSHGIRSSKPLFLSDRGVCVCFYTLSSVLLMKSRVRKRQKIKREKGVIQASRHISNCRTHCTFSFKTISQQTRRWIRPAELPNRRDWGRRSGKVAAVPLQDHLLIMHGELATPLSSSYTHGCTLCSECWYRLSAPGHGWLMSLFCPIMRLTNRTRKLWNALRS